MRRRRWHKFLSALLALLAGLVAAAGTLAVAGAAFLLSFNAIEDVARWSHIDPRWAWVLPVAVDGAMAVATVAAVVLHRLNRPTRYPWIVLFVGAGISIFCNALHAWAAGGIIALPRSVAMAVSAVPPVLLAMSVHLLAILFDAASRRVGPQHSGGEYAPTADAPTLETGHANDLTEATDQPWPVDLLRRIPVNQEPYRQWQAAWRDLADGADPATVTKRHGYSLRTIQFVRQAGQQGLLEFPTPPARMLAEMAGTDRQGQPSEVTPESSTPVVEQVK